MDGGKVTSKTTDRNKDRISSRHLQSKTENDGNSENTQQLHTSKEKPRSKETRSTPTAARNGACDSLQEKVRNPLRIPCLERPTRRTKSRSGEDLQPFIDMDLNTIGQDSSVDTDRSRPTRRRTIDLSPPATRSTRVSTKVSNAPTTHESNETLTEEDIKVLFSDRKRRKQYSASNMTVLSQDQQPLRLIHGSSSEISAAAEFNNQKDRRTSHLRPLNYESANAKKSLISPLGSSINSDLLSIESASLATTGVSIPAASNSYINSHNYVTKPRWDLRSQDVIPDNESGTARSATVEKIDPKQPLESPRSLLPGASSAPRLIDPNSASSRPSSGRVSELGDNLFSCGLNVKHGRNNPLGTKMDVLSMEKVFNDPSFHGIYEQYSKNRCLSRNAETARNSPTPTTRKGESPLSKALREQLPNQVAILDQEVLSLLTEKVLRQNPLLRKLQQASFRRRNDGTIECLSIMDLGLEKKDHQFLTETWLNLGKLTDGCRQIYEVIEVSGCGGSDFVKNIMAFMSHAVDEGLELAAVLIKTSTFVVMRDGQPNDLLDYVQRVRQLTESLNSYTHFLDTVREVLMENFNALPLIVDHNKSPTKAV